MICKVCKILTTTHFIQEHKCVFTTPGNLCILIYSSERFSPTFSILGGYSEPRPRVQVISTVCGLAARKNLHSLLNFLLFESAEQCSLKRVCTMSVPLICGDLMLCNSKTYLQIRFLCRLKTRISREEQSIFSLISRISMYSHASAPTRVITITKEFPRRKLDLINGTDLLCPCCRCEFSRWSVTSPPTRIVIDSPVHY